MARPEPLTNQSPVAEERTPALPAFTSVLFAGAVPDVEGTEEPAFFSDLNLDQVVGAITLGLDEYDLTRFFHVPLRSADEVGYRHEVFRDLERGEVRRAVQTFAEGLQRARRCLGLVQKQRFPYEKERWFLDAARVYCAAVSGLADALAASELGSRGFRSLRSYLTEHVASTRYRALADEAARVRDGLGEVRYSVRIKGLRVTVSGYEGEPDYSAEVERDFERFRQGDVDEHRFDLRDPGSMNHVEAQIADRVALLFPDAFRALDEFASRHRDFLDPTIVRFDREAHFYLAYLAFTERIAASGLPFSYPVVSAGSKDVHAADAFDLALAAKLALERGTVVRNDFSLGGPERLLVVTGPNQGGKTTFARMFGQLHWLASLGLPVPARDARLILPDRIFTHFEREEEIETLRGKLDDELVRIRDILEAATPDSIVLLNEVFSSTTLEDAILLGKDVLERIVELGALGVCVTFVDELAQLGDATVSMVATVAPDDPAERTFKVVRRPADGRAYALALAEKYGLTRQALERRVGR